MIKQRASSPRKKISAIHFILVLSFFLNIFGIWWGLPSDRGWAADEITPFEVLSGINHEFFSDNWYHKYPPFHYYLLSILYIPFLILHKLHALNMNSLPVYTTLFYLGRFLSVLMGVAIVFFVYKCGQEIYDRRSSLFAALMTSLIVPFVYYSKMANLDVPYIFWFMLSLFFFIRILKSHQTKYYVLLAIAAVFSLCTKDQVYGLYFLMPLVIFFSDWMYKKKANNSLTLFQALLDRNYLISSVVAIVVFLTVHNVFFNFRGFFNHFRLIIGQARVPFQIYENTFFGQMRLLWQTLRQIQFSLGWPLFFLCLLGMFVFLFQKKKNLILLALLLFVISYYLTFIAIILYNYDRFNIPICIIFTFFGGKYLCDVIGQRRRFFRIKVLSLTVLFVYACLYSFSVDMMMVKDSRYYVEKWMKKNISQESLVAVTCPLVYAPRLEGFKWYRMERSLRAFNRKWPDYVIFNIDYSHKVAGNSKEYQLYLQFHRKNKRYKLILHHRTHFTLKLLRYNNILTNIAAINPEIEIFKSIAPNPIL